METTLRQYKRSSDHIKWFLMLCGLWPKYNLFAKKILSFLTLSTLVIISLGILNFAYHYMHNLQIFCKGMGLAVSNCSSVVKVCVFLLHYDDLIYLNEVLGVRYARDLEIKENQPYLLRKFNIFTYLIHTYAGLAGATLALYGSAPLIVYFVYGKSVRVYPQVYPFDIAPGSVTHWMIYGMELVSVSLTWGVIGGVDNLLGLYSFHICGELRVLGQLFNGLHSAENYKEYLKECVERHQMLIESKNRLENLFGLITIWIALSGAIVLCTLTFQLSEILKTEVHVGHIVHLICYLIPKSLQIFMYAYYGNLITEEVSNLGVQKSEDCLNAIYNSDWTDSCDSRFKNDILIVLTQEPLVLVAKGCMCIQLDMFTKIVKTSMSYFYLLQALNEKSVE